MERLLSDAEKISGVKYDVSSLSDITDAIEVIQTKMNITGTTSKEAMGTMEGSTKAAKAAWDNWLTELGKDDGDIEGATSNLMESVTAAAQNVIPRVVKVLTALAPAISEQLPSMIEQIGAAMEEEDTLNKLGTAGMDAFKAMLTFVADNLDPQEVSDIIGQMVDFLATELDVTNENSLLAKLGEIGFKLLSGIVQGIVDHGGDLFNAIVDALWNAIDMGIAKITTWLTGGDVEGSALKDGESKGYTMHADGTVTWHANGGVYDKPTVVGVGEAGKEAIMPLRSSTYDEMARGIQRAGGTGAIDYDKLGAAVGKHVGSIRAYVSASDIDGAMGRRRNYANRGLAQ